MNNGKTLPSLDGRYAATRGMTSLIFYQGTGKPKSIGFLKTFKNPIY